MRKIFKIIIAELAIITIVFVALASIILLCLVVCTAAGSQTLTPTGTSSGEALVIYDPGLS